MAGNEEQGNIMTLKGFDFSNYRASLDPALIDFDFAFAQTTYGAGEISNPNQIQNGVWVHADEKIQTIIRKGRIFGFLHYIRGVANAESEADFALRHNQGYIHHGVPAVDWEHLDNSAFGDISYLDRFLTRWSQLCDVPPLIYCSGSDLERVRPIAEKHDCGLWVASYADGNPTGWQDKPWGEDKYPGAVMRQYSSNGRIPGYDGPLDLDIFYGTADQLKAYAKPQDNPKPIPVPNPTPAPPKPSTKVYVVKPGDTLSQIAVMFGVPMSAITGYSSGDPNVIKVGETLRIDGGTPTPVHLTVTVQPGDTLSGIAARYHTTWQALAASNGIKDPNRIYPGQKIKIA